MKRSIIAVLLSLCFFEAIPQETFIIATDNQLKSSTDSLVHQQISEQFKNNSQIGISLGIAINNQRFFYNYGTVKKGVQQLPTSETIYEIGSITKTFTGILLAQAVIEKKIDLNKNIRKFLKDSFQNLQYHGEPITLKHLATHTSGLPEDIYPEKLLKMNEPTLFDVIKAFNGFSSDWFMEELHKIQPDTIPGTKITYSNIGFNLLGIILENIFGESYPELIKKYITNPIGMEQTETVPFTSDTTDYTIGYDKNGKIMPHITYQIAGAAGGLKSTTNDMLKYIAANMDEKNEAIKLSHQKAIETKDEVIGLGWQIQTLFNKNDAIWHNGGEPGFSSYCLIIPEKKCGIICLTNQRGRQYEFSLLSKGILTQLLAP